MAKHDNEEEFEPRKQKRKFNFDFKKFIPLIILLIGFILGVYLTHEFVEPMLNSNLEADLNSMQAKNFELDKQLDQSLKCLDKFEIDRVSCTKLS